MQYAKAHQIVVSEDETHHLFDGKPLYSERFLKVLKFHDPGFAPVISHVGAYHIGINGVPNYNNRFIKAFGFYKDRAAVEDRTGWYHIHLDGTPVYGQRYNWCGNYQHEFCVVKNNHNEYFHIDMDGNNLYINKYRYAGDFRDGIAVVCRADGLSSHIDSRGELLHNKWFDDLDTFHKGYARAKNKNGWMHINKSGSPIYPQHYSQIEPFYNGIARVETARGGLELINERGQIVGTIRDDRWTAGDELSSQLVGFWKSQTIFAAAKLKLFDYLPAESTDIATKLKMTLDYLNRLLRGLWDIGLVTKEGDKWQLTPSGDLFVNEFYTDAAIMWHDVNSKAWENLPVLIAQHKNTRHPSLKESCTDESLLNTYHKALDGYAEKDFFKIIDNINWEDHKNIIGCERTGLNLLFMITNKYNHINALVLGHKNNLDGPKTQNKNLQIKPCDITKSWIDKADAICLARCLHYWPNEDVIAILDHAKNALTHSGKIYIWEMLLEEDSPSGSLLDLNMLAETGGRLRTRKMWNEILQNVGLKISRIENQLSYLTLMEVIP